LLSQIICCIFRLLAHNRFANARRNCGGKTAVCDSEVGVNLKQGYNGDLTARQAGSIGGQMVNIMIPKRTLHFDRKSRINRGHTVTVGYAFSLAV